MSARLTLPVVDCKYGAPMGRNSNTSERDKPIKLHLQRVPFVDGAYDRWGPYWGAPADLWCAWGDGVEQEQTIFVRAPNRTAAKQEVLHTFPLARFYR